MRNLREDIQELAKNVMDYQRNKIEHYSATITAIGRTIISFLDLLDEGNLKLVVMVRYQEFLISQQMLSRPLSQYDAKLAVDCAVKGLDEILNNAGRGEYNVTTL